MINDLGRCFVVDNVNLSWDRWGVANGAPPFLLCHGFGGLAHDFALHIESIAVSREVVAIDGVAGTAVRTSSALRVSTRSSGLPTT